MNRNMEYLESVGLKTSYVLWFPLKCFKHIAFATSKIYLIKEETVFARVFSDYSSYSVATPNIYSLVCDLSE